MSRRNKKLSKKFQKTFKNFRKNFRNYFQAVVVDTRSGRLITAFLTILLTLSLTLVITRNITIVQMKDSQRDALMVLYQDVIDDCKKNYGNCHYEFVYEDNIITDIKVVSD